MFGDKETKGEFKVLGCPWISGIQGHTRTPSALRPCWRRRRTPTANRVSRAGAEAPPLPPPTHPPAPPPAKLRQPAGSDARCDEGDAARARRYRRRAAHILVFRPPSGVLRPRAAAAIARRCPRLGGKGTCVPATRFNEVVTGDSFTFLAEDGSRWWVDAADTAR